MDLTGIKITQMGAKIKISDAKNSGGYGLKWSLYPNISEEDFSKGVLYTWSLNPWVSKDAETLKEQIKNSKIYCDTDKSDKWGVEYIQIYGTTSEGEHFSYMKNVNDSSASRKPSDSISLDSFDYHIQVLEYGDLRFNEVMSKSCHNAYAKPFDYPSFFHLPNFACRSVELDLWSKSVTGDWSWWVSHDPPNIFHGEPYFEDQLRIIKAYTDSIPQHDVITVFLEMKSQTGTGNFYEKLSNKIRKVFGDKIYRPSELLGSNANLKQAVKNNGWPKLDSLRGKILFVVNGKIGKVDDFNPSKDLVFRMGDGYNDLNENMVFVNIKDGNIDTSVHDKQIVSRVWLLNDESDFSRVKQTGLINFLATDEMQAGWSFIDASKPYTPLN